MFQKAWPRLLRAAAAEAVMEKSEARTANPPSAREVEYFLVHADKHDSNEIPDETIIESDGRLVTASGGISGEFRGRSGTTRQALIRNSGGNRDQAEVTVLSSEDPGIDSTLTQIEGRAFGANQTEGRVLGANQTEGQQIAVQTQGARPQPTPNLPPLPIPRGQLDMPHLPGSPFLPQQQNGQPAISRPQPPQPVNPDGNRLNSNRVENRSTLTIESRDAARPGVVIHKSYIKK